MDTPESDRIERERHFHDFRFASDNNRRDWHSQGVRQMTLLALNSTYSLIQRRAEGKRILEFGCGEGEASLIIASKYKPHSVVGIDLSEVAVQTARALASEKGLANAEFEVMNAEALLFQDDEFDLVCGFGILHHLDISVAASEIARVVRPNGTCIFLEPMGHNPVINAFRWSTPSMRTPDEHPLLMQDFDTMRRSFGKVNATFVNLCTMSTIPFAGTRIGQAALRLAATADEKLFQSFPFLGRYAWNAVVILEEPL